MRETTGRGYEVSPAGYIVGDMVRERGRGVKGKKTAQLLRSVNISRAGRVLSDPPCDAGSKKAPAYSDSPTGRAGPFGPALHTQNVYLSPSCIVRGRSALIACRKNGDRRSPTTLPKFTRSSAL
jgi:hypothetical protein